MFQVKKLPSSIGQLNALQELDLTGCSHLEELLYWPIECTPKALVE
jgi:hypothetical protein